jgi:serine/threonine protein kinase
LADELVHAGFLTGFQAEKLLAGKWRGFLISGKYRLLHRVGAGGMGAVYLCEHVLMQRQVALKVLPLADADDPSALDRFYREARAIARLDHPNIVRAHDIDREGKLHFLVLEYVDGCNLYDLVKSRGALSIERAAHYIRQAALGLQHAHEAGLVHRDIKPGNLLLDRQGNVKLLDLGLARFFHEEENAPPREWERGSALGTADYIAPEQVEDSMVDIRADIYSLGATFYYLLAGRGPFHDGTTHQKLMWHQVRLPKPIRVRRPEVPEEMARVLEKMMAKDPEKRFQVPLETAAALEPWTQKAPPPPTDDEIPRLAPAGQLSTPRNGLSATPTPISRGSLSPVPSHTGARIEVRSALPRSRAAPQK